MCISQIDAALENANCQYPNSYPTWNKNLEGVECGCLPGTAWNRDNSACIDSKQAALEGMDCSQFPGAIPNYDTNGNLGCACPDGLPWIQDLNRCANQQDVAMASMDCSQYPGAIPNYDTSGNLGCACPEGLPWNQDLNRCANQQDVAMASMDCSQYPGSVPGWDYQNNTATCNCPIGAEWNQYQGRCISEQELAMANMDCSHLPRSAPTWSIIYNRAECVCQEPYTSHPMTGECVDFAAQFEPPSPPGGGWEPDPRYSEEEWENQPEPINNCGRLYTVQELKRFKDWYIGLAQAWKKTSLSAYGYLFFAPNVGLGRYLDSPRYARNVEIWQEKVSCYDRCSSSIPMRNGKANGGAKQFQDCATTCRHMEYDNSCND